MSAIYQLLLTQFWLNFKDRFLGPSWTDLNCNSDICSGKICPGDICPYQEYLSWYWPDFDQTLKVQWDQCTQDNSEARNNSSKNKFYIFKPLTRSRGWSWELPTTFIFFPSCNMRWQLKFLSIASPAARRQLRKVRTSLNSYTQDSDLFNFLYNFS